MTVHFGYDKCLRVGYENGLVQEVCMKNPSKGIKVLLHAISIENQFNNKVIFVDATNDQIKNYFENELSRKLLINSKYYYNKDKGVN